MKLSELLYTLSIDFLLLFLVTNLPLKYYFIEFLIFGCACYPYTRPFNQHKLTFRSKQCILLGYCINHKGYKCLDPRTGVIIISRHVQFDEHHFPYSSHNTASHFCFPNSVCFQSLTHYSCPAHPA